MAEIELVIKIDEEQYKFIKQSMTISEIKNYHALYRVCCKTFLFDICKNIANGTPLPQGHGRLKDVDRFEPHDEYDGQGFTKSVYQDDIDNLPTIIEADKESEK